MEDRKVKSKLNPNTTPIGEDDYYFIRKDLYEFIGVYYNPDSFAGGQFVILHLPFDFIIEASKCTESVENFFEYLDEYAKIVLIDLDTIEFEECLREFEHTKLHSNFLCIGRNYETMNTLVSISERNK